MSDLGRYAPMMERVRRRSAEGLLKAGHALRDEVVRDLSGQNPGGGSPAPRGEYPRQRTGELARSVVVTPDTVAGILAAGHVRVGFRLAQRHRASFLFYMGWKGIRDTKDRIWPRLRALITSGG